MEAFIERWIQENGIQTDASEKAFASSLRGLFRDPKNLSAFFGRIAALVNEDVITSLLETVPIITRASVSKPLQLKAFTAQNSQLIKNISGMQAQRIAKVVRTGEGRHVESLRKEFQKSFGASEARAKLWARDQTLKLHAQITQERHAAVGIERYFWTDSNDERVRVIHAELGDASDAGKTYAYKDPPVMSEDGRRGNPGEDYQCRCTAYPAI